jgi:TRAP-type C4-dicarboxylate transport system substrate-binding protein
MLRGFGYQPVGLETEQILPSLSTGMVNAVPVPPFLANAVQYTRYVRHMIDLNWVPIVGAAVVRHDVWEKIPEETRAELMKVALQTGERIRARAREEDVGAIAAMRKRGLTVHTPDAEVTAAWRAMVEQAYPKIRGTMVPADLFDRVMAHLAEFRAQAKPLTP